MALAVGHPSTRKPRAEQDWWHPTRSPPKSTTIDDPDNVRTMTRESVIRSCRVNLAAEPKPMVCQSATIGPVKIGPGAPLAVIAGPCVIETREHTLRIAQGISHVCESLGVPLIFKASFDKANRSSINSFRGPGIEEGLSILAEVKETVGVPVLSDIHLPQQASAAGEVLDCVQIPAFLCRQTDLLAAAASTGRCVNVKKGQFMSPEEMGNVAAKLTESGCTNFLLTERGTFFGYNRLVNDMTAIERMQSLSPVVFDATQEKMMREDLPIRLVERLSHGM